MRYPFRWRLNHHIRNRWPPSPRVLLTDPRTYFNLVIPTSIRDQDTPAPGLGPQILAVARIPVSASPAASAARTASASSNRAAACSGFRGAAEPPTGRIDLTLHVSTSGQLG